MAAGEPGSTPPSYAWNMAAGGQFPAQGTFDKLSQFVSNYHPSFFDTNR